MSAKKPFLVWVESKEDKYTPGSYLPCLDPFFSVPGDSGYIDRGLFVVRGNILRGRPRNQDTVDIYYVDDFRVNNLATNKSLHGTIPTLIGDTLGEKIWKGPIVVVMRAGNTFDPPNPTDISLTTYRDAIDYLGYFRDTIGSMIDEPGSSDHLSKVVLARRAGTVRGVRVNCTSDKADRGEPDLISVRVPKSHPLFNLEGDNPLRIPDALGLRWVWKSYTASRSHVDGDTSISEGLANPLASRLRLLSWDYNPIVGSVLIVDRNCRDINPSAVRLVDDFIQARILPQLGRNASYLSKQAGEDILSTISPDDHIKFKLTTSSQV
jgi:hypothetical protein